MNISTNIWDRLFEVLEADKLDDIADKLGLNPSTLRGRKARSAIPYEQIIQTLDAYELAYVFKGKKLEASIDLSDLYRHSDFDEPNLVDFERKLDELTQTIEQGPFSRAFKIRLVATTLRIAGEDLKKLQNEHRPTAIEE